MKFVAVAADVTVVHGLLRGATCPRCVAAISEKSFKCHHFVAEDGCRSPISNGSAVPPNDFSGVTVTILFAVFFVLFAAWMFLGWMIGESRDIRWMRNWCAGIFVITALASCLAGGALLARRMTQASCRASLQNFSRLLNERAQQGRMEDVRDAVQHLAEQPDEWSSHSPDILSRIDELTHALEKTARPRVASKAKTE